MNNRDAQLMNNRDAQLIAGKHHGYGVERGGGLSFAALSHGAAAKAWDDACNPFQGELTPKDLKRCTELTKKAAEADIAACRARLAILAIKIKDPKHGLRYSNLAEVEDGLDELQKNFERATDLSHFFAVSERAFALARKF